MNRNRGFRSFAWALVVISVVCFSGCATIIQPGPDRIKVDSSPEGAKVFLDDSPVGLTPMVLVVPRDSDCRIRIVKTGYEPYTVDRDKVVAGWVFGNILLGGVIGLSVDLITHHQGKYPEDPIYAEMAADPSAAHTSSASEIENPQLRIPGSAVTKPSN